MSRVGSAIALIAGLWAFASSGPSLAAPELDAVKLGAEAQLLVPRGFERERSTFLRGEILTLTRGDEIIVVSLYRSRDGKAAPQAEAARKAHVDSLTKALRAKATPVTVRPARLLGRARATTAIALPSHPERSGFVVAAGEDGVTVVVVALFSSGSEVSSQVENLVDSIAVKVSAQ